MRDRRRREMPKTRAVDLQAPEGLEARAFTVAGDQYVLFEFPISPPELPAELSDAERDVAARAMDGQSKLEIARARNTSVHTVTNQLRSIYQKLRISSLAQLVSFCTAASPRHRSQR
jgi:DNA-binding CsgD family transcriptional regulator